MQPNDNIDFAYAAHVAAAPFGPLPPGEGDIEWHPRPRAQLGVAGYYNLVPTDIRAAHRRSERAARCQDGDGRIDNVAVWQGGVELRARLARRRAAGGVVRPLREARRHVRRPQLPGRPTRRRATSSSAAACRSPRASAAPTSRATGRPVEQRCCGHPRRRAGRRAERLPARAPREAAGRLHAICTRRTRPTGLDAGSAPTVHRVRAAVQLGF